jgi:hypothetical protein
MNRPFSATEVRTFGNTNSPKLIFSNRRMIAAAREAKGTLRI